MLIKEKNIARAAEKLYISQPAMSRSLQKLRLLFDDPLFHRESTCLRPTVKTLALAHQLNSLLKGINSFINTEVFDPASCNRSFSISIPPVMSHSLMLPFIKTVNELAPNIMIELHPMTSSSEKYLENGKFDFSFDLQEIKGSNFTSIKCGSSYPVIYARKGHPLSLLDSVSIGDCLEYKFLDLIIDDHVNLRINNLAKKYFEENNIELEIIFRSSQLGLLTEVMKQSEHLFLGSHFLMDSASLIDQFDIVYPFSAPEYQISTYLTDHQHRHTNTAHQWLKSVLIDAIRTSISRHKKSA